MYYLSEGSFYNGPNSILKFKRVENLFVKTVEKVEFWKSKDTHIAQLNEFEHCLLH